MSRRYAGFSSWIRLTCGDAASRASDLHLCGGPALGTAGGFWTSCGLFLLTTSGFQTPTKRDIAHDIQAAARGRRHSTIGQIARDRPLTLKKGASYLTGSQVLAGATAAQPAGRRVEAPRTSLTRTLRLRRPRCTASTGPHGQGRTAAMSGSITNLSVLPAGTG